MSGLGLLACQEGFKVKFFTAAGLVTAMLEARDEKLLGRFKILRIRKDQEICGFVN